MLLTLDTHRCCQSHRYRAGRLHLFTFTHHRAASKQQLWSDTGSVLVSGGWTGKQVLRGPQDGNVSLLQQGVLLSTGHSVCFQTATAKMDGRRKWENFLLLCKVALKLKKGAGKINKSPRRMRGRARSAAWIPSSGVKKGKQSGLFAFHFHAAADLG